MKHVGKLAVLGAVLAVSTSSAFATTITLGSWSNQANSGPYTANPGNPGDANTAVTYNGAVLTPTFNGVSGSTAPEQPPITAAGSGAFYEDPLNVWANPPLATSVWVGPTMAGGPQGTGISNANDPAQGFYTYETTFSATGLYSLSLNVLADDTIEVFLNNTSIPIIGFGDLFSDGHCAGTTPNCLLSANYNAIVSLSGTNDLYFVVEQAGIVGTTSDPTGFDFNATVSPAPEPSSLMLLGTGLVGAAGMFFRRRQTV